jgi:hypothetical protein
MPICEGDGLDAVPPSHLNSSHETHIKVIRLTGQGRS